MGQLINSRGQNLRSGWKIVFDVLMVAAKDPNENLRHLGLNILQRLLDENLDWLCPQPEEKENEVEDESDPAQDVSTLENRNCDSDAEDFITMCRASLAYVQLDSTGESPAPIGLSLRALCHTA